MAQKRGRAEAEGICGHGPQIQEEGENVSHEWLDAVVSTARLPDGGRIAGLGAVRVDGEREKNGTDEPDPTINLGDSVSYGYTAQKFAENFPTEPPSAFEGGYLNLVQAKLAKKEAKLGNKLAGQPGLSG